MDFIEAWFGISPDGGDGSAEAMVVVVLVAIVIAVAWMVYVRRKS